MIHTQLVPHQLDMFTSKSLRVREMLSFDPLSALASLKQSEGKPVWAVDIGGTFLTARQFSVKNGELFPVGDAEIIQSSHGAGYLQALQAIGKKAERMHCPVAVSTAGTLENNRYLASHNLSVFLDDFNKTAGGDFHVLLPTFLLLINDAVAGMIVAVMKTHRHYPDVRDVIYIVNGSGLGGAVYNGAVGKIYACEPGEVAIVPELNVFHQQKQLTFYGNSHTTLELVGASKAGIEDIYFQKRHEKLDGKGISKLWQKGDSFANELYQNSALITAHAVIGTAKVFGLLQKKDTTAVVFHGGIFHVPGYKELVDALLRENLGFSLQTLCIVRRNPGLEGAALAALTGIC